MPTPGVAASRPVSSRKGVCLRHTRSVEFPVVKSHSSCAGALNTYRRGERRPCANCGQPSSNQRGLSGFLAVKGWSVLLRR
jgi:hypothetical protein